MGKCSSKPSANHANTVAEIPEKADYHVLPNKHT